MEQNMITNEIFKDIQGGLFLLVRPKNDKVPDLQEILSKDIICTFATNIKYAVPLRRFSQPLFSGS